MLQQVRDLEDSLLRIPSPVLVVPHSRADIDALASAHAVSAFLRRHGVDATVCAPTVSSHAELVSVRLGFSHKTSCDVSGKSVVVVDTSSVSMLDVDVSRAAHVFAVDHHRGGDLPGYVRQAVATAVLVYPLVSPFADCRLLKFLAAAIFSDTAGLYAADSDAFSVLSEIFGRCGVTASDIFDLLSPDISVYERIARLRALERMNLFSVGEFVLVTSRVSAYEGSSAWLLVQAGADLAFVGGHGRISARLSNRFIRASGVTLFDIMSRIASDFGGSWGGHEAAAGVHVQDVDVVLRAIPEIVSSILRDRGMPSEVREF